MKSIVVFALAWGPKNGGINAFNEDFCIGLKKALHQSVEVVCIILGSEAKSPGFSELVRNASEQGIRLMGVPYAPEREKPDKSALELIRPLNVVGIELCVGHDLFTGWWALALAREYQVPSAVFHHMAIELYKPIYGRTGDELLPELKGQEELLSQATYVVGVGPRLADHAKQYRLPDAPPAALVPGLATIESVGRNSSAFTGVTIGRISGEKDILKQGRLAAQGFAQSLKNLGQRIQSLDLVFQAIGLSAVEEEYRREHAALAQELSTRSGGRCRFIGHKFNEDRGTVYGQLKQRDVFYMLSLHEGFGLAGFEAIAAGVPLVLSRVSGLFGLLQDYELSSYVSSMEILTEAGSEETNIQHVAELTCEIFGNRQTHVARAIELRDLLLKKGCTWESAGTSFLKACKLEHLVKANALEMKRPAKTNPQETEWPWRGLNAGQTKSLREMLAWPLAGRHPIAQFVGTRSDSKTLVLRRFREIIRWDLHRLFRADVRHVPAAPAPEQVERLNALQPPASTAKKFREGLIVIEVENRSSARSISPAWATALERAVERGWRVLIETPQKLELSIQTEEVSWSAKLSSRTAQVRSAGGWSSRESARIEGLLSSTAFGLTFDEMTGLLGTSPERVVMLSQFLRTRAGKDLSEEGGVWRTAKTSSLPPESTDRFQLLEMCRRHKDAALVFFNSSERVAGREHLRGALEWVIQAARSEDPSALSVLTDHLAGPASLDFGRPDLVLTASRAFFRGKNWTLPMAIVADRPEAYRTPAQALLAMGRPADARGLLTLALERCHNSDDPSMLVATYSDLASASFLVGQYREALNYLDATIEAANRSRGGVPHIHLAAAHRTRAELFLRMGQLDLALSAAESVNKHYALGWGDRSGAAAVAACRSTIELARGDATAALKLADEGTAMSGQEVGSPIGPFDGFKTHNRVAMQLAKARALLALARPEAAMLVGPALDGALAVGAVDLLIDAQFIQAETELQFGNRQRALKIAQRSIQLASESGMKPRYAEAVAVHALMLSASGSSEEAAVQAKLAMELAVLEGAPYSDAVASRKAQSLLEKVDS